jgi:WD40 repeat protein
MTAVAFSPDGKWLATSSNDGTAKIWDAQTRAEVHKLDHEGCKVYSALFNALYVINPSTDLSVNYSFSLADYAQPFLEQGPWHAIPTPHSTAFHRD